MVDVSPFPCGWSLSIVLGSSICRIQTNIGKDGQSRHQPMDLDIRHGHQPVLSGSGLLPSQESLGSTKAEVEQVARNEEASPQLTIAISAPASDEGPRG